MILILVHDTCHFCSCLSKQMKGKSFFRGRGGSNFEFGLLEGQLKGVNRGEEAGL